MSVKLSTKTIVQIVAFASIFLSVCALVLVTGNAATDLSPYRTYSPTLQATQGVQGDYGFINTGYEFTITGMGWDPASDGSRVLIYCAEGLSTSGPACPQYICTPAMGCDSKYFVVMASDGSFSFPLFGQGTAPGPYLISASQGTNCAYVSNGAGTQCTIVTAYAAITIPVAGARTGTSQTTRSQPPIASATTTAQSPKTVSGGGTLVGMAVSAETATSVVEGAAAAVIATVASTGVAAVTSHLRTSGSEGDVYDDDEVRWIKKSMQQRPKDDVKQERERREQGLTFEQEFRRIQAQRPAFLKDYDASDYERTIQELKHMSTTPFGGGTISPDEIRAAGPDNWSHNYLNSREFKQLSPGQKRLYEDWRRKLDSWNRRNTSHWVPKPGGRVIEDHADFGSGGSRD